MTMPQFTQADWDAMDAIIPIGGGYQPQPTTIAEARAIYAASRRTRADWAQLLADEARIETLIVTTPDQDHVEPDDTGDVEWVWVSDYRTSQEAATRLMALLDEGKAAIANSRR